MKSLKQFVVVTILAALACTALHAQSVDLRATIPFDFHAGARLLPAGEYVVQEQGAVVILKSAGHGGPASIFLTNGVTSRMQPRSARLEFDRYGAEYFLTAVWSPFSANGRVVPKTNRQKEFARRVDIPLIVGPPGTK